MVEHEVTLRWGPGSERTVGVAADESVVDATERAGLGLPYGCLFGACGSCTGHVSAGRIEHSRPPRALKPHHLDDGYALLCIAQPRTDCRIEVGPAVLTELVSNPWK